MLDAFVDAFHRCCTLLIVAKLGDMSPTSRWGTATPVVLWVPKWTSTFSAVVLCTCTAYFQKWLVFWAMVTRALNEWFILTVPRLAHKSETAWTPQPSENNDTRRWVSPFNTAKPRTNAVLTAHTHGVWLLEVAVSFLDTKLLPMWKFIFTIHAIRTGVTGYWLTLHGRIHRRNDTPGDDI